MNTQALNASRQRIIIAISKISETLKTQDRAYVDSYLNHVSPSLASRGDSMFPMSLRRHPSSSDRTMIHGRGGCLCFVIGNAIFTYYDAAGLVTANTNKPMPAFEESAKIVADILESRIGLLEDIAKFGFENFKLVGDTTTGYTLERKVMPNAVPAAKLVQASRPPSTGGGAGSGGSK